MTSDKPLRETRKIKWWHFAVGFAVWTLIGLSFASRTYLYYVRLGVDMEWKPILYSYLLDYYLWGLASPFIFLFCRRYLIERQNLARHLLLHACAGVGFTFAVIFVSILSYWYLGLADVSKIPTLGALFAKSFFSPMMIHEGLIAFWMTAIAAHAFEFYHQSKVGKLQTAELSAQLANAQLSALKMQLHPHFLFNTLNSIAALLHKDVEAADRMVARLSDFLRLTLKSSETHSVSLERELEFLNTYLEIEKIRFQNRLVVETEIEPEARAAQVPNLILQPIVENAVRHGLARVKSNGLLRISARIDDGKLTIEVEDNGPGFQTNGKANGNGRKGVGLANTTARLERFYKGDYRFEITDKPDTRGTVVSLVVPFIKDKESE